jgi:hypothetical protein
LAILITYHLNEIDNSEEITMMSVNAFKGLRALVALALFCVASWAGAYMDTARLVSSNEQADFYVYTGSIKKGREQGDFQATGLINLKAPREDGTRSAFRVLTYHCTDPVNRQFTVIIDTGHALSDASGPQTYSVGPSVGRRFSPPANSAGAHAFDFVCGSTQSATPTARLAAPSLTGVPPPIRAEAAQPRNSLEAYEEQERRAKVLREFERDKENLAAKNKLESENQLIQNGYIVRCSHTPHMIGGYIFYQGQRYPFERWTPSSYDQRGWRIRDPQPFVRRGNVLQWPSHTGQAEFYLNESVIVEPVAFGGAGLQRRNCAPVSGSTTAL